MSYLLDLLVVLFLSAITDFVDLLLGSNLGLLDLFSPKYNLTRIVDLLFLLGFLNDLKGFLLCLLQGLNTSFHLFHLINKLKLINLS